VTSYIGEYLRRPSGAPGIRVPESTTRRPLLRAVGRSWLRGVRPALSLSGLALLTAAAWTVALPLGLAVAGASCLLVEFLLSPPGDRPRKEN
jgi:hypothetical protein